MNEKTRAQIEAMKNQTIGVEVEMNNITRQKAAAKVAEFFGTTPYYAAAQYGYMTWACKDQQGRVWKFQRDVSISGPDDEKCELVTPILTYDDIETLQSILRLLRKAGAKSSPSRGCGVHIHIGKGNHTAKTLRNLVNIMASHEEQIGRAIRIDAGRTGHYCKVVNQRFLEQLNKKKPTTMSQLEDIWYEGNGANYGRTQHYNDSRYHMLNLHQGHDRVPAFPIRRPPRRQARRAACRRDESLHPALPGHERACQGGQVRKPQAPADRQREIRIPVLDASAGLHRRGIRNGKGDPSAEHGGQRKLAQRISADLHGHLSGGRRKKEVRRHEKRAQRDTTRQGLPGPHP